mmetsp:Transcript_27163/g.48747  ORF Transcript_27163/g.48747 Transcript_27163/m.48747 type:complete len:348 (-) Transcript_27163:633-1676(-)
MDRTTTSTFLTGIPKILDASIPQAEQINGLYSQIQSNISDLDKKVSNILTQHEADFLNVYRGHMFNIQKEMRALKDKADAEESKRKKDELVVKLEHERDWFRNEAVRLDEICKEYKLNFEKWRSKAMVLEDDRNFLEKQLLQAKKEIKQLQDRLTSTEQSVVPMTESKTIERFSIAQSETEDHVGLMHQQSEATILHLQRQLKAERRSMRALKSAKSNYLLERGELEEFFLECVENVRKEVLRRRLKSNPSTSEVKLEQFTETDKRKVLELLVADERVLLLVHERIFPTVKPVQPAFTPSKILPSRSYSHLSRQSHGHGLSSHKLSSPFFTVQKSQRPSTAPRVFKK